MGPMAGWQACYLLTDLSSITKGASCQVHPFLIYTHMAKKKLMPKLPSREELLQKERQVLEQEIFNENSLLSADLRTQAVFRLREIKRELNYIHLRSIGLS